MTAACQAQVYTVMRYLVLLSDGCLLSVHVDPFWIIAAETAVRVSHTSPNTNSNGVSGGLVTDDAPVSAAADPQNVLHITRVARRVARMWVQPLGIPAVKSARAMSSSLLPQISHALGDTAPQQLLSSLLSLARTASRDSISSTVSGAGSTGARAMTNGSVAHSTPVRGSVTSTATSGPTLVSSVPAGRTGGSGLVNPPSSADPHQQQQQQQGDIIGADDDIWGSEVDQMLFTTGRTGLLCWSSPLILSDRVVDAASRPARVPSMTLPLPSLRPFTVHAWDADVLALGLDPELGVMVGARSGVVPGSTVVIPRSTAATVPISAVKDRTPLPVAATAAASTPMSDRAVPDLAVSILARAASDPVSAAGAGGANSTSTMLIPVSPSADRGRDAAPSPVSERYARHERAPSQVLSSVTAVGSSSWSSSLVTSVPLRLRCYRIETSLQPYLQEALRHVVCRCVMSFI